MPLQATARNPWKMGEETLQERVLAWLTGGKGFLWDTARWEQEDHFLACPSTEEWDCHVWLHFAGK